MSRTVMIMVMLAGIALLVGILVVFRGSHLPVPGSDSRSADTSTVLLPSKMIGRSALSHGGPVPIKNGTARLVETQSGSAEEPKGPMDAVQSDRTGGRPSVGGAPSEEVR